VTLPHVIEADQAITVRLDLLTETPGVRARLKINGELMIDEYGAPPTVVRGGVAAVAYTATAKLELVEVLGIPATVDRVGPNP